MSLTIPAELSGFASLAGVPGELFTLDEDALEKAGNALARFADTAGPHVQNAAAAASDYVAASDGAATDAFAGFWRDTGAGAEQAVTSAGDGSAVLLTSAQLIKAAKVVVIAALAWLAGRWVMSLAAGGPAAQAAAVASASRSVKGVWAKLIGALEKLGGSMERLMGDLARPAGTRLAHATGGPGSYGALGSRSAARLGDPFKPSTGVTRMDMAERTNPYDARRQPEEFTKWALNDLMRQAEEGYEAKYGKLRELQERSKYQPPRRSVPPESAKVDPPSKKSFLRGKKK